MPAHRIRKARLKKIVVARQQIPEQFSKRSLLIPRKVRQPSSMPFGQNQGFKRPHRPPRHYRQPVVVHLHHPILHGQFVDSIVAQ